jgi:hypothetical protein
MVAAIKSECLAAMRRNPQSGGILLLASSTWMQGDTELVGSATLRSGVII